MQSTSPASLRSRQRGLRLGKSNFKIKNEVWRFIFIFPIAHFDFSEFFSHLSCLNKTRIFFISFNVFCDASCLRKKNSFDLNLLASCCYFIFHVFIFISLWKKWGKKGQAEVLMGVDFSFMKSCWHERGKSPSFWCVITLHHYAKS